MDCRYAPSCTPDEWSRDDKLLLVSPASFLANCPTNNKRSFVARFAGHELRELPRNFRLVRRSRGYGFEVGRVTPCAPLYIACGAQRTARPTNARYVFV